MAPEAPIKAPTTVRSCDPSTNPSAHRAHPLDEFNTVITTGVSPPPTARVACAPRNAPSAATYASEPVTDKTRRQYNCPYRCGENKSKKLTNRVAHCADAGEIEKHLAKVKRRAQRDGVPHVLTGQRYLLARYQTLELGERDDGPGERDCRGQNISKQK